MSGLAVSVRRLLALEMDDVRIAQLAQQRAQALVLPAEDPFGGGRLLPSGRLREPLAAIRRALDGAGTMPAHDPSPH